MGVTAPGAIDRVVVGAEKIASFAARRLPMVDDLAQLETRSGLIAAHFVQAENVTHRTGSYFSESWHAGLAGWGRSRASGSSTSIVPEAARTPLDLRITGVRKFDGPVTALEADRILAKGRLVDPDRPLELLVRTDDGALGVAHLEWGDIAPVRAWSASQRTDLTDLYHEPRIFDTIQLRAPDALPEQFSTMRSVERKSVPSDGRRAYSYFIDRAPMRIDRVEGPPLTRLDLVDTRQAPPVTDLRQEPLLASADDLGVGIEIRKNGRATYREYARREADRLSSVRVEVPRHVVEIRNPGLPPTFQNHSVGWEPRTESILAIYGDDEIRHFGDLAG